jgi:beta-phosphoglucomutase-like phosphatase (HAD superfamily)
MRQSPAAAAAAPAAPDSARITLEHFEIDMRVDEVLPLREQALYAASGGVPFLPGVEEFVRAMNKAGVRMAVATSSPTRLLQAKSTGKEAFVAMFEGVVCGNDVQCAKPDPRILLKAVAVLGVPSCFWDSQCPRPNLNKMSSESHKRF